MPIQQLYHVWAHFCQCWLFFHKQNLNIDKLSVRSNKSWVEINKHTYGLNDGYVIVFIAAGPFPSLPPLSLPHNWDLKLVGSNLKEKWYKRKNILIAWTTAIACLGPFHQCQLFFHKQNLNIFDLKLHQVCYIFLFHCLPDAHFLPTKLKGLYPDIFADEDSENWIYFMVIGMKLCYMGTQIFILLILYWLQLVL